MPLKEILGRLEPDLPAAVFVVMHIPARGIGILSSIAKSVGKLPVVEAQHGRRLESGHVYLAAPDHHLLLMDGHMILGRGPRENLLPLGRTRTLPAHSHVKSTSAGESSGSAVELSER